MPKKPTKHDTYEEEQLILSKERTILSFMRTGLSFVTVGIVIAGFFDELQLAQIVGYILIVIGFVEVFESMRRLVVKQRELNRLKRKINQ